MKTGSAAKKHDIAASAAGCSLFDPTGRLVPFPDSRVYSQTSRRYFTLLQPKIDYGEIHGRIEKHLAVPGLISRLSFEERCLRALEGVRRDERTRGLLNAVHVPFFCTPDKNLDMGKELDTVYLPALKRSYEEAFPKYSCTNYFGGQLEGQLEVFPGCRYESFLEARKRGPVVGWYFPNPMAEFAVPDQRSHISRLPEKLVLSGALDATAAMIGTPGLIMKTDDNYPHLLCMSAIQPKEETHFYHFEAYGWNLEFNRRSYLGTVSEYWAGGLIVLG